MSNSTPNLLVNRIFKLFVNFEVNIERLWRRSLNGRRDYVNSVQGGRSRRGDAGCATKCIHVRDGLFFGCLKGT